MKRAPFAVAAAILIAANAWAAATGFHVLQRIKVPDGGFDYATFDPATDRVYMPRGAFTTVIDSKTGAASELKNGEGNHIALPVPGTNLLVVTQGLKAIVRILDKNTDVVLADLPAGKNPNSAAYDPVTKLVFVMNKDSGNATVIDPVARKVVDTVPISSNTLEFPVADGAGHVFDNIETTAEIAVIDTRTRKVTGAYKIPGCEEPTGLAYIPEGKLLVSSCGNRIAAFTDSETGKQVATVPIGEGPDAVIYDPARKVVAVPCGRDGVLVLISVADPAHPSVLQRINTQAGSRTGTVDTKTGRVYLMASRPDPSGKPAANGRGVAREPGSWEVFVVAP